MKDIKLEFTTTKKGNRKPIHEGYMHVFQKKTWRMMQHHESVEKEVEEYAREKQ